VLLYEELGEFPTSLKAPVFAMLIKSYDLSAAHLKVLLSNDQKKLDFSIAPRTSHRSTVETTPSNPALAPLDIITSEHVLAVAERCRDLEHLDLHDCQDIIAPSGISTQPAQTISALAAGCPNLTFLDISYVHLVRNLADITHSCRHLRVLRAVHSDLVENALLSSFDLIQPHLEELDVSLNPKLDPLQPLSRLFPGNCPKLRVLRMNAIGTGYSDIGDAFLEQLYVLSEEYCVTACLNFLLVVVNEPVLKPERDLRRLQEPLLEFNLLSASCECPWSSPTTADLGSLVSKRCRKF
jgi:hypothetical protein